MDINSEWFMVWSICYVTVLDLWLCVKYERKVIKKTIKLYKRLNNNPYLHDIQIQEQYIIINIKYNIKKYFKIL